MRVSKYTARFHPDNLNHQFEIAIIPMLYFVSQN